MVIRQGDLWWADLGEPVGSEPAYRRPVVIVQCDAFNRSRLATVVCVPLTSNLKWGDAPGNVLLESRGTGLAKDSGGSRETLRKIPLPLKRLLADSPVTG